jgi:NADH-quinone oxidoreductase subunit G
VEGERPGTGVAMVSIVVDGKTHEVKEGQNLLQACLSLGYDLPYFCWHPILHSVGACRQCAVKQFKDENDAKGRIIMSCMTPVSDGMRVSIEDAEAKAFRKSVIEWLMTNHPHDCPICDEGGSCHLQDMTVMAGHNSRRFRFKKRTHRNQDLGPFLNHEMNRCIQCYRCVRFYRHYAGGRDLDVMGAHNHVYFGRYEDGALENEFSGNLAEICPTGVFTDKTLKKHYTRKWDLQWAPSVCPHCGVGCNVSPGERYGALRCVVNRFNPDINGYAICDRGRFGYEHVNSERRIRVPLSTDVQGNALEPTPSSSSLRPLSPLSPLSPPSPLTRTAALQLAASALSDPTAVIGIGSSRASLEANFALRELVGPERFFAGISDVEYRLCQCAITLLQAGPVASVADVERCDAVIVLGEDLTNTAPRLALAVRQAVRRQPIERAARFKIPDWDAAAIQHCCQNEKGPLLVATSAPTKIDDVATWVHRAAPDDIARLGHDIAKAIVASPFSTPDSSAPPDSSTSPTGSTPSTPADEVAQALLGAKRITILSGIACGSEAILRAAASIAQALRAKGRDARLHVAMPECNTMGLALMRGKPLNAAFDLAQAGKVRTIVVLENDLFRRADAREVSAFLDAAEHVIALDCLENATTARSHLVLPCAAFGESSGTFVNSEGRAQRFYRSYAVEGDIQESWRWLRDVMIAAGRAEAKAWNALDDVIAAMAKAMLVFAQVPKVAPPADFRTFGRAEARTANGGAETKIPRQPHRYSGRTAMNAHRDVNEPKPPDDPDSALAFSMEGYNGAVRSAQALPASPVFPPELIPFFWSPGWNSPSALNKYQSEIGGTLRGAPGEEPRARRSAPSLLSIPSTQSTSSTPAEPPPPFQKRPGEWLVVPLHHIFGSEELSALSPAITERIPAAYVAMNPADAENLGAKQGEIMEVVAGETALRLPLLPMHGLPEGLAGMPVGLPGAAWIVFPQWVSISREAAR